MNDFQILEELERGGVDLGNSSNHYYINEYNNKITDIIFSDIIFKHEKYDLFELICELNELKFLTLQNCNINSIPDNISNLIHLTELDLLNNQIKEVSIEIDRLSLLDKINLSNNKIEKIPSFLFDCYNLKYLDLSSNKIKSLHDFSSALIELDLSNNQIDFLFDDISLFTSLKILNLNKNNIKWIPKDFINIKATVELFNNPITQNILDETQNLHQNDFIKYLLSIQEHGEPLNEAKVLVLGDERVGKTSIINKIVGNNFESNQTSTQGIDIQNHYLSNDITVNIWDFAGQEITHQTHQFFLSTRSLYLFVVDAQKEDNDSAIYDWLETIQTNSSNSPIIIVVNKYDLNKGYTFDINRYQKDFPNIRKVIYTSAKNNINIEELEDSIEVNIETLENTRAIFNKHWLTVKTELEILSYSKNIDYIEGGKFDDICENNGIDEELDQQTLLTILHEIGTIVRYENSKLNSVQIINPLWVTNAVYKIIRSEFLNENAILHKDKFSEIFKDDKRYRERHYQWIMDLLVQFELAFRLDENRVLIPSKLPNNEPDFDITAFQQGLNLRYRYEGRLKKSFISQFMVKMSDEIDKSSEIPYWQRGVFLKYGNCKAVVISEEEKKTITISIDTQDIHGREFLSNIRREFKKINKSIEVEEEVPLILDEEIVGFADYENLILAEEEGDTHFRFKVKVDGESKSHKFKISDLLYGYKMVDESEVVDTTPLIITEGKTDWKHLKKVLERFKKDGLYQDLNIRFEEYEDTDMGDAELDRMVQTYCKTKQSKKHIFMFDRDNNTYVKKYAKKEFNNHGNNVYSFCIPKISDELDKICIEFYYKKEDLITKDKDGKRIFIGEDFLANGNSNCGQYVTAQRNAKELDILDRDKKVYFKTDNEWKDNIALSKNDFTNNIINGVEGFDKFDIEYFILIFDVIEKIVND